jgi:hypothetical protein
MHGLITINKTNNLTEASQGIFRLRNINIGHTIDIYNCIGQRMNIIEIYNFLETNDIMNKEQSKSNSKLQCLKFLKRKVNNYFQSEYEELIYYSTIYNIPNIDYFIKYMLFPNFKYNDFSLNYSSLLNINQSEQQNINININVDIQNKMIYSIFARLVDMEFSVFYTISDYLNFNVKTNFEYDDKFGDEYLNFLPYFKIILSYEIQKKILSNNIYDENLYFIIKYKEPIEILVIVSYELNLLLHDLELNKEKYEDLITKNDIHIYNRYGCNIYKHSYDKKNANIKNNFIKLILLQNSNIDFFNKITTLRGIIKNVSDYKIKLDFIKKILCFNYDYNYNNIPICTDDVKFIQYIFNIDFHCAQKIYKKKYHMKYLKYKIKYSQCK